MVASREPLVVGAVVLVSVRLATSAVSFLFAHCLTWDQPATG